MLHWTNGQLKLVCLPPWYSTKCQFLNGSQCFERLGIRNVAIIDEFHLVSSSLNPQDKRSYCLGVHDLRQRFPRVLFELPPHSFSIYFNPLVFCYPRSGPVSAFHGSPANAILAIAIHQRPSRGDDLGRCSPAKPLQLDGAGRSVHSVGTMEGQS